MGEYLSPGVYVEEVDKGSKPIESVGTSTVGFLGESHREGAPVNQAVLCTNWSQFTQKFGDFKEAGVLAHAVYGFFNNGGGRCFVTNVAEARKGGPPPEASKGGPGDKGPDKDKGGPEKDKGKTSGSSGGDNFNAGAWIGKDNGPGKRTGLKTFEEIEDINIVSAPGVTDKAVQQELIAHSERMNRFAILDSEETLKGGLPDAVKSQIPTDSSYAAFYFPWIEVYDPVKDKQVMVPPSGHVCGVYARTDGTRGVHKAPANEVVRGALGLKYTVTKGEQDLLNPSGINCIREFSGQGIRIWGGRTISSDPSWRYINVRRLFIMVEESIKRGTNWIVFEPNDQTLWKRITRNISAFLLGVWRMGALFGTTPEEAFYVKCDEETNPPDERDLGKVTIEIGLAPVKPAEFVIFRISQWQPEE
jgi:phage tail sheath protein FI